MKFIIVKRLMKTITKNRDWLSIINRKRRHVHRRTRKQDAAIFEHLERLPGFLAATVIHLILGSHSIL